MAKRKSSKHKLLSRVRYGTESPNHFFLSGLRDQKKTKKTPWMDNTLPAKDNLLPALSGRQLGVKERGIKSIGDTYNKGYRDGSEKGYAKKGL